MPVPASVHSILTPRERQIFASVIRGETTRQIAVALGLRYQTVKNYLTTIYDKLGVANRIALCAKFSQAVAGVSLEPAQAGADGVTTE
jgi:DNA-binding CsgD family transcriptional regulator